MTYLVPYDGTTHAKAGLYRARQYADALGDDVVAVTVVPRDPNYARQKGWIETGEQFDAEAIQERIREEVLTVAPDARFRCLSIGRHSGRGAVGRRIKRIAREMDVDVLVVGSENAGRVVTPAASIGGNVAASREYDVLVVRNLPRDDAFRDLL